MKRNKNTKRLSRHKRVRAKIKGTKEIPRVSVFKSNQNVFIQFIDDIAGKTIFSSKIVSSKKSTLKGNKTQKAQTIGETLAKEAIKSGIKKIVFDRGGFRYQGRIKAVADGLRAGGLEF
jgi:large subunit ribosomal protein L18